MLDEVDGGLVTRYAVLVGNPPDAPELPTSLAHHQALFEQAPAVLTADRAFFTLDNDQLARDLRIRSIALPRQGPLTPNNSRSASAPHFDGRTAGGRVLRVASACSSGALGWIAAATTAKLAWSAGLVGACWPTTSARSADQWPQGRAG